MKKGKAGESKSDGLGYRQQLARSVVFSGELSPNSIPPTSPSSNSATSVRRSSLIEHLASKTSRESLAAPLCRPRKQGMVRLFFTSLLFRRSVSAPLASFAFGLAEMEALGALILNHPSWQLS